MAKKKVIKPPVIGETLVIDKVSSINPELEEDSSTDDPVEKVLDEIQEDEVKDLDSKEESLEAVETAAVVESVVEEAAVVVVEAAAEEAAVVVVEAAAEEAAVVVVEAAAEAELPQPLVEELPDETPEPVIDEAPVQEIVENVQTPEPELPPVVEASASTVAPDVINKPIEQWTLEDTAAFVRGESKKPISITEREVIERARQLLFNVCQKWECWGVSDIHAFLKDGTRPTPTSGGFYKNDPARAEKKAANWKEEELVDFLKGELKETRAANEVELYQVIAIKWRIVPAWSEADIKEFVLFNRSPKLSVGGYWSNDVVREAKPAVYWTKNELMAFVSGEISATAKAPEKELYAEVRVRFGVDDSYSVERLNQLLKDYIEEELPMSLLFVKSNLDNYAVVMGKGAPVTEQGAGQAQALLYNTFSRVLRLEGRLFVDGWTMILDFVSANRNTMFDERNSYRGVAVTTLSDRDRRNHEQLLNLVIKTANPESRYAEAVNTNFTVALDGISDEAIRQRILSYYQINK
jgi:hypothetical protein